MTYCCISKKIINKIYHFYLFAYIKFFIEANRIILVIRDETYDDAVDWWSLGVVLHEMIVGRLPFSIDHSQNQVQSLYFIYFLPQYRKKSSFLSDKILNNSFYSYD